MTTIQLTIINDKKHFLINGEYYFKLKHNGHIGLKKGIGERYETKGGAEVTKKQFTGTSFKSFKIVGDFGEFNKIENAYQIDKSGSFIVCYRGPAIERKLFICASGTWINVAHELIGYLNLEWALVEVN